MGYRPDPFYAILTPELPVRTANHLKAPFSIQTALLFKPDDAQKSIYDIEYQDVLYPGRHPGIPQKCSEIHFSILSIRTKASKLTDSNNECTRNKRIENKK
ncbi:hypothetical protein ACU8KH_01381 [Lachancea thermotolerans]